MTKKKTISYKELVDTLQIIHVQKKAQAENPDEYLTLDNLKYALLDNLESIDESTCTVELSKPDMFAIWLAIDVYKDFAKSIKNDKEIAFADNLLSKFSWK